VTTVGGKQKMANGNFFLLVTNELAQQTLDAMSFPIKITVPDHPIETDGYSLGEAGIEVAESTGADLHGSANESASEADKTAILLRNGHMDVDDEDIELFNAYKVDSERPSSAHQKGQKFAKLKKTLLTPFKKLMTIELVWVKIELDRPGVVLGDPVVIRDMVVRVQVKFRACGKFFGKRLTRTFTTELFTLEARQLTLALQTSGAKVEGVPSFTDVDVVLNFSMFGFYFTSQPEITAIVNKQLHKRGPLELLDLSSFEKRIPFSRSKLGVSSIAFAPDPKGLIVNMSMRLL
jgi:hypothetical protein